MFTHRIDIEAKISNGWSKKEIQNYCDKKLCFEVDDLWGPMLKSLEVNGKTAKASILIQSVFCDFKKYTKEIEDWIHEWIGDHITEEGILISKIDIIPYW